MGIFFTYALNCSLSFVVVSKLGKIDGAYDTKATLPFGLELRAERLYPILKRHGKAPYLKGITKKDTHTLP
jgi:hypothetical protein